MANPKGGIGGISLAALIASDPQAGKPITAPIVPEIKQEATNTEAVALSEISGGQEIQSDKPARKRKPRTNDKLSKRGLHLSDSVMMRLTLLAIERKQSLSQVANTILSANLPQYTVSKAG